MKFEKITAGMKLYDVHRERAGNTAMRRWGTWDVRIISVDTTRKTAVVSWNGNPPRTFYRRELERLRKDRPVMVNGRPERREEKKARLAYEREALASIAHETGESTR